MSRILESHSASWLFALEWTFKEDLIGVQAFQVKFAACAQATMWTSKHLSVTLVWWQWTVYVSSANVARNSRNFLCYPKCQVAKLKAEADNEFTITLKTLGATKDTQC